MNINDRTLWGNEAADDESPEILRSYFVSHPVCDEFFSFNEKFSIARARKGMGKSALISILAYELSTDKDSVVINIKGADLVAQKPVFYGAPDEHIHDWMQRICMLINREIGNRIKFAINDDEMLLVEAAELSGYKKRNLFASLLSRIKVKIPNTELSTPEIAEHIKILDRITESERFNVWVLIDDIDATFINTDQERRRLSTFFSACREVGSSFRGINIRATLRTDVWASIRKHDESLDKVEQYILDLIWSKRDIGKLLAKRIVSYESRIADKSLNALREQLIQYKLVALEDKRDYWQSELKKVFPPVYPWGTSQRANYVLLYLLGAGRPRWILQLCRMSAKIAVRQNRREEKIKLSYIKQALRDYSSIRLDDICREHQHQCASIAEIINYFSITQVNYTTEELLNHIDRNILGNIAIVIDGDQVIQPKEVAQFLFRAGFFVAQDNIKDIIQYLSYEDRPDLLRYESNLDDGMRWTIHPAFRAALNIENE